MIREAIGRREFVGGAGCLMMLALAEYAAEHLGELK